MAAGCWATVCSAYCLTVHAYWALIENSDLGSKGGLLTNRLHLQSYQPSAGGRWHTKIKHVDVYACLGADAMKARCCPISHWMFWQFFKSDFQDSGDIIRHLLLRTPAENGHWRLTGNSKRNFCWRFKHWWLTRYITMLAIAAAKLLGGHYKCLRLLSSHFGRFKRLRFFLPVLTHHHLFICASETGQYLCTAAGSLRFKLWILAHTSSQPPKHSIFPRS